jgi:hypothetical protein
MLRFPRYEWPLDENMKVKPNKLVNAQEMSRQYSDDSKPQPRSAARKLRKGDLVKVSNK